MFWKKAPKGETPAWLIVGLGNPGAEYRGTRHNVGFEVIDRLAQKHRVRVDRGKHRAMVGVGVVGTTTVALVKPLTYMNLSGQSVGPLAREYGIAPERVLVVADDLDLPVAKVRLRMEGSAGGHNGHKSLISTLGTQAYPRIKVGVGKVDKSQTVDHVLSPFSRDERERIDDAVALSAEVAEALIESGPEAALRVLEGR